MNVRLAERRDRRMAQLRARPRLSAAEHAEFRALEARRDRIWKNLPRRIGSARARLAALEAYAAEIGLGPV